MGALFLDETYDHQTLFIYLHARNLAQRAIHDSLQADPENQQRKKNEKFNIQKSSLTEVYCVGLVKAVFADPKAAALRDAVLSRVADAVESTGLSTMMSPPTSPGDPNQSFFNSSVSVGAVGEPQMAVEELLAIIAEIP